MNPEDLLEASLLDLLYELRDAELPLILAGGYGLYRKRQHVLQIGARLIMNWVPPARSTNDLDVFLRTEVLANSQHAKLLRDALDRLGYEVITGAEHYQFVREIMITGARHEVKIDLLTREPDPVQYPNLKYDTRRVRPRPSVDLHAHTTKEAIAIEEDPIPVTLSGSRTTGEAYSDVIYLPQAYPYLMMKLFAFRDQHQRSWKGFGREHALDLYTLVSILTEAEYQRTLQFVADYETTASAEEAAQIVTSLFATPESLGPLRLREHQLFAPEMDVPRFLAILREIFPPRQ
jgi:hypothetical protein